jgi:hypothetical protein
MTIKICIVGTTQSGSTRLFNLTRCIYEKKNKSVLSQWNYTDDLCKDKEYDIIISKIHDCDMSYLNNFDIVLLPIRNILDAAISYNKRWCHFDENKNLINNLKKSCYLNIDLFNKFKSHSDFIFIYEKYSIHYINELCSILNVKLNLLEIIEIMKELDNMLFEKEIVKNDDFGDELYKKTLLCQSHNTSGGASNKFIKELEVKSVLEIMEEEKIKEFLKNSRYI